MWKCVGFCLILFSCDVYGYLHSDTLDVAKLCCNEGSLQSWNRTGDCSSLSIPPGIPRSLRDLCSVNKAKCCAEYQQKNEHCRNGIDTAEKTKSCSSTFGESKACCESCLRGVRLGEKRGANACVFVPGQDVDAWIENDSFVQCCKKASEQSYVEEPEENINSVVLSRKPRTVPSICEEYAPNELCAHHCIPIPGSYRCECNPGFMLMADRRNCKEVVKSRCKPNNPCQQKCYDNGIEIKCTCRRGYELMPDGKSCQDIDECQLDIHVCWADTKCINMHGTYKCLPNKSTQEKGKCPPGFAWNITNHACDDINECLLPKPPCPSYLCKNTVGAYKCGELGSNSLSLSTTSQPYVEDRCPPGFKLGVNEECEDVDECTNGKDDCNTLSQFCINTHGAFYCQDKVSRHCPPGFKIDPRTNKCEDINECEGDDVCRPDQICINKLGQYDCKSKSDSRKFDATCPDGMEIVNGKCEDIDECLKGTHLCDQLQKCLNTNGSYECHCRIGYELDISTGTCIDMNECATERHNCLPDSQRCDNTVGSFLCIRRTSCGTGYILQHSTGICEDIDECAIGTHNCARAGPDYQCINLHGSFRCVRKISSTSTTPEPLDSVFEYYYDSEEDITETDSPPNINNSQDQTTTSTTTAPKIEISSEAPTTTSTTTETYIKTTPKDNIDIARPEDNNIEPPPSFYDPPSQETSPEPDIHADNKEYSGHNQPNFVFQPHPSLEDNQPKIEFPAKIDPIPDQPVPTYASTESVTKPTEPNYKPEYRTDTISESPRPAYTTPEYQRPDTYNSVQPHYNPESYNPNKPEHRVPIDENEINPQETTYNAILTEPNSIPFVNVNVGKTTETLDEVKKEDGSAVINAEDRAKETWPKVGTEPIICSDGFVVDELGVCNDIDECVTYHHNCNADTEVCHNTMGGYVCTCAPGFQRDFLTHSCDAITTSTSTTTTTTTLAPTTVPSTTETAKKYFWGYLDNRPLTTRPFRPRNLCDAGFHRNSRTGQCEDINECTNGQANCAAVEICVNTVGGYRCDCPPNWKLDEIHHRCVSIRSMARFPTGYENEPTYTFENSKSRFGDGKDFYSSTKKVVDPVITHVEDRGTILKCPRGYRLGDDNTCEDINECATGQANCGPIQICTNLVGGYTCACPTGFKMIGDHECQDVDECSLAGSVPICSQNADCVNTIGSFQCKCHHGFKSAEINDKVCVDVDECLESSIGTLCQHNCNNVWGGYRCSCHRGYRLSEDNSTCTDVNECAEFKSRTPCVGRCVNIPGSYRCTCPSGYRLSVDKKSCIDIDECETGEATCANSGASSSTSDVCFNTRGGYRCHKNTCPPGYRLENKHRCSKIVKECLPGDWECTHQPSTISYNFFTFVSKLYIPESKLNLFTMRGPAWPSTTMTFLLQLVNVDAPPNVKDRADINAFLLSQNNNEAVISLVRPLEGPQSIELDLTMEVHVTGQFGGIAVAKLIIYVSEFEF